MQRVNDAVTVEGKAGVVIIRQSNSALGDDRPDIIVVSKKNIDRLIEALQQESARL
jgi:hypothetical protein